MVYQCIKCNYETADKSNYNKHLKCRTHLNNCGEYNNQENGMDEMNEYKCQFCEQTYSTVSNLSKHEKKCVNKILRIKELEIELKYANQKIKDLEENHNTNTTIYNLSIKKFIQQQYSDAPPLLKLDDYSLIKYEGIDEDDDNHLLNQDINIDDEFISTLSFNYNNDCLHKYLGDFVIKYYKKNDPKQQSVWSSDVSRLTYVIKELLDNHQTIWNHDYKGVKTKNCIINPLLRYIKKIIDEYWISHVDNFRNVDIEYLNKLFIIFKSMHEIKKEISNGKLSNAIIRYITPHFYMNKNNLVQLIKYNESN